MGMRQNMDKRKPVGKRNDSGSFKEKVGHRFRSFREAIGKTQSQLARAFKVYQSTITNIEVGKTFPNIKYLQHLGQAHRLNADWIINDRGEMLVPLNTIPAAVLERYSDLLALLQVPIVEQLLMARLEEIKVIAREDIQRFQDSRSDSNPNSSL
jgi:transcriptional regulator with XRE-family HTH domain